MASSLENDAASEDRLTERSMAARRRLSSLPADKLWHGSAPLQVRSCWNTSPHGDAWLALRESVGSRRPPALLAKPKAKKPSPLEWGAGQEAWTDWRREHAELLKTAGSPGLHGAIEAWVDVADNRAATPEFGLECVQWAYSLGAVAAGAQSEFWWRLVEQLVDIAQQASAASLGEEPPADQALASQLLGGELPLVLARSLSDLKPARALGKQSSKMLTQGVLALTDGEGLPAARLFERLPPLFACWTRCRTWAESGGKLCWSKDAEAQYEWLVRQALRLSRPDATLAFSPPGAQGAVELMRAALELAGDDSDAAAARSRLGRKTCRRASDKAAPPTPAVNSDWSGASVLASGWKKKSQRAVVTYEAGDSRLEYAAAGHTIFCGPWTTTVTVDRRRLSPVDTWDEQCWYSDEDCDYLELSLKLERGVKLERQVLIAREDKVAYLADLVVTGKQNPSDIELATRLTLAPSVVFDPRKETRDGSLVLDGQPVVGVAPAGLPEWRIDTRGGELEQDAGELVLRQRTRGRSLCCPLFLDASASRFKKQCTWRQLAVAHSLETVANDVAVAYRFQSGKQQWVSYRSLDPPANRTFLGHNLSSETLFGRFLKSGEVDEFFEIENE